MSQNFSVLRPAGGGEIGLMAALPAAGITASTKSLSRYLRRLPACPPGRIEITQLTILELRSEIEGLILNPDRSFS
jgi:hypothetical protein